MFLKKRKIIEKTNGFKEFLEEIRVYHYFKAEYNAQREAFLKEKKKKLKII